MTTRWVLPEIDSSLVHAIASATELPIVLAEVLVRRGISSPEAAHAFLHPSMQQWLSPWLLHGMHAAVARLRQAVQRSEPILIYGDYDVDGTTATVLLKTAIDRITPAASSLVRYHIPHRIREGYGMQTNVLAGAAEAGVRLVISVDTGIRAFAAAEEAKAQGIDLIVTDHHLPDDAGVPEAIAVINPNQPDCTYPFKDLCGAAVACKLAHALLLSVCEDGTGFRAMNREALDGKFLPSFFKLLSVATIADSMPLLGENRAVVALGLEHLKKPNQPGLRSLMELSNFIMHQGIVEGALTARDVAFRIAPRINAAGRMDTASDVVQLFLTKDAAEARMLAEKLNLLNTTRRETEARILEEVEQMLAKMRVDDPDLTSHGVVVLDGEGWHRGVVGILASRVLERTGRPALVIAHEEGHAHGSGRSIPGFHLLDAITAAHEDMDDTLEPGPVFDRFGGHAFAVGFALASPRVETLRRRLRAYSASRITEEMMTPEILCDAELSLSDIGPELLQALELCQPFGHSNEEPLLIARTATIIEPIRKLKERHAKIRIRQNDGPAFSVVCWARQEAWPDKLASLGIQQNSVVDLVFYLRENKHPDFGGPELELRDIRLSAR